MKSFSPGASICVTSNFQSPTFARLLPCQRGNILCSSHSYLPPQMGLHLTPTSPRRFPSKGCKVCPESDTRKTNIETSTKQGLLTKINAKGNQRIKESHSSKRNG